jgi:signal transduction histidine kinase
MPRTNSLTFRLIAGAAIWTVLGLVAGGFVLSGIFRNTVESSFDSQLVFNLDGLIAAAESDSEDSVTLEGRFTDPRFERIFSGWYWQIRPAQANTEFQLQPQTSRSLWDQTLTPGDLVDGENNSTWGYADGPDQQRLRVLMRRIALPVASAEDVGQTQLFDFVVAGDISETEANIVLFNRTLRWSIAVFSLGLIAAMFIQVRVGLMPLRVVSEALARIREGRARRLEGEFPTEIAPLATELNSLIAHSSEVVGRARGHVANLAHFLKTPLTVLANEAATASGPLAETVSRQVTVMRRQVDHYLARARAAGALDVLGSRTEVAPVLNDLARVLKRMHAEKELTIEVTAPPALAFRGEREDLEEMAGNLIDNACKWAHSRITVEASPMNGALFSLRVNDDGPGLEPEERARAMQRGERFDESVPGTGLGLAIVRDIAKLYGGNVALDESPIGGLAVKLELPRAR